MSSNSSTATISSSLKGLPAIVALLLFGGCSTHASRLMRPRSEFYSNDLHQARAEFDKLAQKGKQDSSVLELDLAMVELFQGDVAAAERRLQSVRDEWDRLQQKSFVEDTSSYLTDDQIRAYAGEDYEKLLVRVMLSLCSLMQDGVDAEAYSLQTLDKQRELFGRAKERWDEELPEDYCVPTIAPYLRGMLLESTHTDYHEAARYYEESLALLPDSPLLQQDLERAQHGVHCAPGHGIVYVIAMVGRGPFKEETTQPATQAALQAADLIVSNLGEYSIPPTIAPVKIPIIVSPPKPFDLLGVKVGDVPVSTTLPISDLHELAVDSYEAKLPSVITRAVVRRVLKKGAVYAAKDQLDVNSDIASFALDAAGVLWEATEAADTRCWGLLPREFQILRLELPSGTHTLGLEPITAGTPIAPTTQCKVTIRDGLNSYVLSYWPGMQPIGKILVSR
ncbi:MAG: hypothetical protein VXZ82_09610 [Planctomycetota bacterium]|nr:hypothetical protein [Planctomycetota bacterium]